ncbi:hypothetical protein DEU38_103195 [Rhodococcus sp. AG1013]|uniref:hypothetical protein n=1 Tax=Rhodococcus sp. AG1013 TaxID=2183996 RepID=UPI000E0B2489|nr:hypothetical protein [Rhodococcus sp. AG1013]RDI32462.1 hypothetical protein DEU38_103195 [Rhodococcus sp. AG1013]
MPPRTRKTTVKPSQADGAPTQDEIDAAVEVIETPDDVLDEPEIVDSEDRPIPEELQFSTEDLPERPDRTELESDVLTVDGFELIAFKPETAAWSLLIGAMSKSASSADKSYAIWDIVRNSFDDASLMYIQARLMDPADKFDQAFLEKIILALIERWAPPSNRAERRKSARRR